jgi:hypothetical protein
MKLLQRLRNKITSQKAEAAPPGFHTAEWYAKNWKLSRCQTGCIIRQAVHGGFMEKEIIRTNENGRLFMIPHYREVKSPPPSNRRK